MDNTPEDIRTTLVQRATRLIAGQAYFRGAKYPITFESFEKILVVRGRVPTFYLKQVLQSELLRIDGVDRVVNEVVVDPKNLGS